MVLFCFVFLMVTASDPCVIYLSIVVRVVSLAQGPWKIWENRPLTLHSQTHQTLNVVSVSFILHEIACMIIKAIFELTVLLLHMCFVDSAFSIDLRISGQMIWCPFRISYLKRPRWPKHSWWLFHEHSVAFFRSLRKFHGIVLWGAFCLIYQWSGNDLAPSSNKPKSKQNQHGGDSVSHKTSSRMTSQSLEGVRSGVKMLASLGNRQQPI